jgi:hypothetical protein
MTSRTTTADSFGCDGASNPCSGRHSCQGDAAPENASGPGTEPRETIIADTDNNRIREIHAETGLISTIAGDVTAGDTGDGGSATGAELDHPYGVAVGPSGSLMVGDPYNDAVRWLAGPQAGPHGSPGTNGTNGTNGSNGTPGRAATLAIADLAGELTRHSVSVTYAVDAGVKLTLTITGPHRTRLILTKAVRAGRGTISWNRRIAKRAAPDGSYTLALTATANGTTARATSIRLKI